MMRGTLEIRHGHLFCGVGGGAKGFNRASARVGHLVARFRCIGGIDVDPSAIRDFGAVAGVRGTVLDLFSREQYIDFHGHEPPAGWREAVPADIHAAFGHERPHILFLSAPCKGFSGLTSESRSRSARYQALNALTERALLLALEAYADDPPEFILFENVPRIQTRGRAMLDRIEQMLAAYGYASAETTHDCGELGGLAQSRKRFLMVCRHVEKVPPFLYEPPKRPLRAVGDILGRMPLPGDLAAGPMHRVPSLQWKTWVRLAFVEAGSDWRSLRKLAVENGYLRDYALAPDAAYHPGVYGVQPWEKPSGVITSEARPSNGKFSVADPRFAQSAHWHDGQAYGVKRWEQPADTITGQSTPGQGRFSVADPRPHSGPLFSKYAVTRWDGRTGTVISGDDTGAYAVSDPRVGNGDAGPKFNNCYRVVPLDQPAPSVTAGTGPSAGGLAVADPRYAWRDAHESKMRVSRWDQPSRTVTSSDRVGSGALSVADPRPAGINRQKGDHYLTAGFYGVVPWDRYAGTVSASMSHDNGYGSVADPRCLPAPDARLVAVIRSLDNTWHRPFTTLELAALQSLVDPEELFGPEPFLLDGRSDSTWREHIGNMVPPDAAAAIGSEIGRTLLLAATGETFALGSTPIWVRPVVVALMAARRAAA